MTVQKLGRDGSMSRGEVIRKFNESERYMYGLNVTFDNLSKNIDYMNRLESNRLRSWLSELYENLTILESQLQKKRSIGRG
nr:MAG TPA: hypothetical protein [Bacteriophage sp.]